MIIFGIIKISIVSNFSIVRVHVNTVSNFGIVK